MKRGFKGVNAEDVKYVEHVQVHGKTQAFYPNIKLPVRADNKSAGYDFFSPIDVIIAPRERKIIWTNIKAYMQPDEVLTIHVRSSIGIKRGLVLANGTGIIDSSYYENEDNDGNIGIPLVNTTGTAVEIKAGERIAQGVFLKYLVADKDEVLNESRIGGIGSSGL